MVEVDRPSPGLIARLSHKRESKHVNRTAGRRLLKHSSVHHSFSAQVFFCLLSSLVRVWSDRYPPRLSGHQFERIMSDAA